MIILVNLKFVPITLIWYKLFYFFYLILYILIQSISVVRIYLTSDYTHHIQRLTPNFNLTSIPNPKIQPQNSASNRNLRSQPITSIPYFNCNFKHWSKTSTSNSNLKLQLKSKLKLEIEIWNFRILKMCNLKIRDLKI